MYFSLTSFSSKLFSVEGLAVEMKLHVFQLDWL